MYSQLVNPLLDEGLLSKPLPSLTWSCDVTIHLAPAQELFSSLSFPCLDATPSFLSTICYHHHDVQALFVLLSGGPACMGCRDYLTLLHAGRCRFSLLVTVGLCYVLQLW